MMEVREVIKDAQTGEVTERMIDMPDVVSAEEAKALERVKLAVEMRTERNNRLSECDWTTLSDAQLDETHRLSWATYRQALRDVTKQAGFPEIIQWPVAPA